MFVVSSGRSDTGGHCDLECLFLPEQVKALRLILVCLLRESPALSLQLARSGPGASIERQVFIFHAIQRPVHGL